MPRQREYSERLFDEVPCWISVQDQTTVIVCGFTEPGAAARLAAAWPRLDDLSKRYGLDLRGFARDFQWAADVAPLLE